MQNNNNKRSWEKRGQRITGCRGKRTLPKLRSPGQVNSHCPIGQNYPGLYTGRPTFPQTLLSQTNLSRWAPYVPQISQQTQALNSKSPPQPVPQRSARPPAPSLTSYPLLEGSNRPHNSAFHRVLRERRVLLGSLPGLYPNAQR